MRDYNDYVGIPWVCGEATMKGTDCWGLIVMVFQDALNIPLNHFNPDNINSDDKTSDMIELIRDNSDNWELVNVPREFDVVMMIDRKNCRPSHVGIYIGNGQVLHSLTREKGISEVHRIKILKRLFKRLEYYRYVG